jgi:hypothetical protein
LKKKKTLSYVYNELNSRPTKCGTAAAQLLQSWYSQTAGYRKPFAVELPFCKTVFPGGGGPKYIPASITNKL